MRCKITDKEYDICPCESCKQEIDNEDNDDQQEDLYSFIKNMIFLWAVFSILMGVIYFMQ